MTYDLKIKQGKTFPLVIRAETEPVIRKAVSGVSFASGAPQISTTVPHGLTAGWRATVTRVVGPTELNAANNPPRPADYHPVLIIDADTVEFNDVVPCDAQGAQWPDYVSGGFLEFYTPVDLTGKTARMKIRTREDKTSTLLASSDPADGVLNVLVLTVDTVAKTISLNIPATATEAFTWKTGYYDIELVGPTADDVLELASGKVSVTKEVTA